MTQILFKLKEHNSRNMVTNFFLALYAYRNQTSCSKGFLFKYADKEDKRWESITCRVSNYKD